MGWLDYGLEVDLEGKKDSSLLSANVWQMFFSRNGGFLEYLHWLILSKADRWEYPHLPNSKRIILQDIDHKMHKGFISGS